MLPFAHDQFNLVVARDILGSNKIDSEKLVRESLDMLTEGGQIRSYPIYKLQNNLEIQHLDMLLKQLQKDGLVSKFKWAVKDILQRPIEEPEQKLLLIITKAGKKEELQPEQSVPKDDDGDAELHEYINE